MLEDKFSAPTFISLTASEMQKYFKSMLRNPIAIRNNFSSSPGLRTKMLLKFEKRQKFKH